MSKSGTWPGGVAMESLSNMDSAGSCDSVISVNSGYSDDSMEYLSAEERACLMYLEETIEALEVQEDSGLSNDEPDAWSKAEKNGIDQIRVNETHILTSESGSHGISLPLVQGAPDPTPATTAITGKAEKNAKLLSAPAAAAGVEAPEAGPLVAQPDPSVSAGDMMQPSVDPTGVGLGVDLDGGCDAESFTVAEPRPGPCTEASDNELAIIPPPSDFMDEPDTPSYPERVEDVPAPAGISAETEAADDSLHAGDAAEKTSESSSLTKDPPNKLPPLTISDPQTTFPEVSEPRSPPAVAPRPKKLPPNIILKSQKAPTGSAGNSGHSVPASADRVLLDPQKVRIEALRKLGLLKSNAEDASPSLSPKLAPKTRQSWSASSPPVSPAAARTPPATPSYPPVTSPPPANIPLQPALSTAALPPATSTTPPIPLSDVLPVPAAFRDPTGHGLSNNEISVVKNVTDASVRTPPLTPPTLVKQLTPPRVTGIKSATLERSGLGLSSYLAHQSSMEAGQGTGGELSPRHLRNNRPRPSSLGSGRDFSHTKVADLQAGHASSKEPDSQRPLSAQTGFQHSRESAKLPRSQGISVLICPRSENGENRREALKKLGLLRD